MQLQIWSGINTKFAYSFSNALLGECLELILSELNSIRKAKPYQLQRQQD